MKKIYGKPDIMFDSFQMCGSIAASSSCEKKIGPLEDTCGIELTGTITVFTNDMDKCTFPVGDPMTASWDGYCYHVPFETSNIFTS